MRALDPRFDLMSEEELLQKLHIAAEFTRTLNAAVGAKCAARNRIRNIEAELRRRNGVAECCTK